jgi:hypothetical protein
MRHIRLVAVAALLCAVNPLARTVGARVYSIDTKMMSQTAIR